MKPHELEGMRWFNSLPLRQKLRLLVFGSPQDFEAALRPSTVRGSNGHAVNCDCDACDFYYG